MSFEDLLLAKVFAEEGILSTKVLKGLIRDLDRGPGTLLELAESLQLLQTEEPRVSQARSKMMRFVTMMNDSIFEEVVKGDKLVLKSTLARIRDQQRQESYQRSLCEMLIETGHLTPDQAVRLDEKASKRIAKHQRGILASYRDSNYEGLARPLTRSANAGDEAPIKPTGVAAGSGRPSFAPFARPAPDPIPAAPIDATSGEEPVEVEFDFGPAAQPAAQPLAPAPVSEAPMALEQEPSADDFQFDPGAEAPVAVVEPEVPAPESDEVVFEATTPMRARGGSRSRRRRKLADLDDDLAADDSFDPFAEPSAAPVPATPEAEPDAPADPFIGCLLDDNWRILKKIGQGAMGGVYLASSEADQSFAAVKVILEAARKPDYVARFRREILATSFFDHENVVQIYNAGELPDGAFYMVLEYVQGEELLEVLNREGRFEVTRALDLIEQVLGGIAAAHAANVVHKDLKPENIMMTQRAGREFVKIMDFGLARILDREEFGDRIFATRAGQITGSPAYMSPESVSGDIIDQRSDLYSIGVTLFQLLTGALPIVGGDVREYLSGHLYTHPKTLGEACPEVVFSRELEELVARLLRKRPQDRPKSCVEVIAAIQTWVRPRL